LSTAVHSSTRWARRSGVLAVAVALVAAAVTPAQAGTPAPRAAAKPGPTTPGQGGPRGSARTEVLHDAKGRTITLSPRSPKAKLTPAAQLRALQKQRTAALVAARKAAGKAGATTTANPAAVIDSSADLSYVETTGSTTGTVKRLIGGTTPANDPYTSPASSVAWSLDGSRYVVTGVGNTVSVRADGTSSFTLDTFGAASAASFDFPGTTVVHNGAVQGVQASESDGSLSTEQAGDLDLTGVSAVSNIVAGLAVVTEHSTGHDRLVLDNTADASLPSVPLVIGAPGATDPGVQQRDAQVSPALPKIAYVQVAAGGSTSVWVADLADTFFVDGALTNATKVLDAPVARGGVAWTPDGLGVYVLETGATNKVVVVPAAGGAPQVLRDNLGGTVVKSLSVRAASVPVEPARLSGTSRMTTAVAISQESFPTGHPASGPGDCMNGEAEAVVLARSDTFPDGLSAGPLAVDRCAPLLLTPPTALDKDVLTEIKRLLNPGQRVYLIGSTGALSAGVDSAVKAAGFATTRIAGANRFATAVAVAVALSPDPGAAMTFFLADGMNFPDALSAASPAATFGGAILLTNGSSKTAETTAYLTLAGNTPVQVITVGRPAATAYPDSFPVVGATRYDTNAKVATTFFMPAGTAFLASGQNFPDALAGGPLAGAIGEPILLTPSTSLATEVRTAVDRSSSATSAEYVLGGPSVVSDAVAAQVATLAGGM